MQALDVNTAIAAIQKTIFDLGVRLSEIAIQENRGRRISHKERRRLVEARNKAHGELRKLTGRNA